MEKKWITLAVCLFSVVHCLHIPPSIVNCTFGPSIPYGTAPPYHLYACLPGSVAIKYPFCNMSLGIDDRITDLISRVNQSDWFSFLLSTDYANPSLGLVSYNYTAECEHAFFAENATVFPQVIGMSSSFNRTLWTIVGIDISSEIRGLSQDSLATDYQPFGGLNCFGPNINIARDPRWGRIQETPGEDPFLSGEYAKAYLTGLQGSPLDPNYDPKYIKIAAGLKHADCYSLERGISGGVPYKRESFNAVVTNQDLLETYLPAFKVGIEEGKASSLMCSYVAVNGVPSCANSFILNDIMRGEYGFDGFVVEDKGAMYSMQYNHNYTSSNITVAANTMKHGCDMDQLICYAPGLGFLSEYGPSAIQSDQLSYDQVEISVRRILKPKFQVGLFDDPKLISYSSLGYTEMRSPKHLKDCYDAALQTLVLLKNDNRILPLKFSKQTVAVIGPQGNATTQLLGDYSSNTYPIVSIIDGLLELNVSAKFEMGCSYSGNDTSGYEAAINLAKNSDIILLCMGLTGFGSSPMEGEFYDRSNISLPEIQEKLMQLIVALKKPTILVLVNGGQIALDWEKENVPAIVEAYYPGQFGGRAIAHGLYGLFAISGRLPYTIYPTNYTNQILMTDMNMKIAPGRTYKYYVGPTLYPFGYGLFYTNFKYTPITDQSITINAGESTSLVVNVTNLGPMNSGLPILAFFYPQPNPQYPLSQLFSFERIHLEVGETKTVEFFMNPENMQIIQPNGQAIIIEGIHRVRIGGPEYFVEYKLRIHGNHTIKKSKPPKKPIKRP